MEEPEQTPATAASFTWPVPRTTVIPRDGDELTTLKAYLDYYRETFALKLDGVDPGRLSERGVPPSTMSLHGLLRHLAGVERWWFRQQFAGEDIPLLYYSDENPNEDFDLLDGDVDEAFAVWHQECDVSRRIVSEAASLDKTGIEKPGGEPVSLRRILVAMIGEYAQHVGQADL